MSEVSLITGASSGIGLATSIKLSQLGRKVILVGRREGPLKKAADRLVGPSKVITANMGVREDVERMITESLDAFGRVDALVNNAGYAPSCPVGQSDWDLLESTMRINAIGPGYAVSLIWPHFQERGGGCIVNVSSMASVDPFPGFFSYAGSKAAINLQAKSAALEGEAHKIRAFSVAPGAVETPMLRSLFCQETIPTDRTLTPEAVADVIVACLLGEYDAQNGETILIPSPE